MRIRYAIHRRATNDLVLLVSLPRWEQPEQVLAKQRLSPDEYLASVWVRERVPEPTALAHSAVAVPVGGRQMGARYAILTSVAYPHLQGGGEIVMFRLAQRLLANGFGVDWFVTHRSRYASQCQPVEEPDDTVAYGIGFHFVPPSGAVETLDAWAASARPRATIVGIDWDIALNGKLPRLREHAPLVIYQQFWQGLDADLFYVPADVRGKPTWVPYFRDADMRIANSQFARRRMEHGFREPFGVLEPCVEDALGTSSRDGEIVMFGAGYAKGIYLFVEIAEAFPSERFTILGEPERQFAPNCHAVGWRDPRPYLLRAKALLSPSLSCETYGMAVMEARKYGVPTIAGTNGASAENATLAIPTSSPSEWIDGLRKLLSGGHDRRPATPYRESMRRFDAAVRSFPRRLEDTMYPEIGTYSVAGFTSTRYVSDTLVRRFGLTDANASSTAPMDACLFHAWHEDYTPIMDAMRACGVAVYGVSHSPLAQAELDADDPSILALLALGSDRLLMCHAPSALALGVPWLPVPVDVDEFVSHRRAARPIGDTIHVGLFNVRGARKNLSTQILACRELARQSGRRVVAHMSHEPSALHQGIAGDIDLVREPFRDRAAYLMAVADFDVSMQATHSESFNLCAIESWLCGVPCIVGECAPAGRFGMEQAFVVADVTNPVEIAQKALKAVEDAQSQWFIDRTVSAVTDMLAERDATLRQVLRHIKGAGT